MTGEGGNSFRAGMWGSSVSETVIRKEKRDKGEGSDGEASKGVKMGVIFFLSFTELLDTKSMINILK